MDHTIKNIKKLRAEKNIKQEAMAEGLGLSLSAYKKLEQGHVSMTLDKLQQIATLLETSLEQLIKQPEATVITFTNQKGGTGKTTLSILSATGIKARFPHLKIALIDCDYQKSATVLYQRAENPMVDLYTFDVNDSTSPVMDYMELLNSIKTQYDLILVDTAGSYVMAQFVIALLSHSDIACIPLEINKMTMSGTVLTVSLLPDIVERRAKQQRAFKALGIANRTANTLESKNIGRLKLEHVKIMNSQLKNLIRYQRDINFDMPIVAPTQAKDEFNVYMEELISEMALA